MTIGSTFSLIFSRKMSIAKVMTGWQQKGIVCRISSGIDIDINVTTSNRVCKDPMQDLIYADPSGLLCKQYISIDYFNVRDSILCPATAI